MSRFALEAVPGRREFAHRKTAGATHTCESAAGRPAELQKQFEPDNEWHTAARRAPGRIR